MSAPDPDRLERGAAPPRYRRLDACLVASVLALFVLVLAGFAAALWFAWSVKDLLKPHQESGDPTPAALGADPEPRYKGQSFAYLRATSAEVKEGVMQWEPIPYGTHSTMGALYTYDHSHRALTVGRAGSYFMYIQLNISCLSTCKNESLTLSFTDQYNSEQLSCTVKLQSKHPEPVMHKCWTVMPHLEKNSRLLAKILSSPHADLKHWKLEPNSSGFGIFLVDGPGPE